MNIEALLLSIRLALCVSAILFVVGVPLAYWLAYSRWRWKFLLEAGLGVAPSPPPPAFGFLLLLAVGAPVGRGNMLAARVCHRLALSFPRPVAGSLLYRFAFSVPP